MNASEYRDIARARLNGHWGLAVGTTLVAGLLGASTSMPSFNFSFDNKTDDLSSVLGEDYYTTIVEPVKNTFDTQPGIVALILILLIVISTWSLAAFILGGATKLGLYGFNKKMYFGRDPKLQDLFSHYNIFGKAFGTQILVAIFTFLWTLLFIIPGIIATFAYSMTFFILEEHPEMDIMDAITASKEMMKGYKWKLFCLYLSFIGWYILSICTVGIGFLFLAPYVNQTVYAFYYDISRKAQQPEAIENGN